MKLLLTLGIATSHPDHHKDTGSYEKGRMLILDWKSRQILSSVEHKTPLECRPGEPGDNINFKGATIENNRVYVTTSTEVLEYALPTLSLLNTWSHPHFNDVHHVVPSGDSLWVVSTGLDLVIEMNRKGEVLQEFSIGEIETWQRFDPAVDYRKVSSTKPHQSHPNYLFFLDKQPWVTRFEQKDAICLQDSTQRIDIAVGNPHDGHLSRVCSGNSKVVSEQIWFTTTNGNLIEVDVSTRKVVAVHDLRAISGKDQFLGWCRGLEVVGQHAFVGFSTLRPTRWKAMASWVKNLGQNPLPTRIAQYDLANKKLVDEFVLPSAPQSVLFTIRQVSMD